ncbi:hypothetical protein UA45_11080 [Morganella morganii]|uniref:Sel1 repeat family protein n=1 Tax=Morganella morganii TaxID=582 RepID=A0A0D8L7J6_MORMO|nr:hypothetical protein UA45_11080 [Morganella morganii]
MYLSGNGTPENAVLGYQWLERAAKAGNKNALYNLGYYRYHGRVPYTEQDPYGITSLTLRQKPVYVRHRNYWAVFICSINMKIFRQMQSRRENI